MQKNRKRKESLSSLKETLDKTVAKSVLSWTSLHNVVYF